MGGFSINSSPEKMQEQLNLINGIAEQNAKKEYALQDQAQTNSDVANQDQAQTNSDVANVKNNLYYTKEQTIGKDAPYSRIRSLGPSMAKNRLDTRGVDTESLITGKPSANESYKKGGAINLKNCKVNTCEKNSKHKHW